MIPMTEDLGILQDSSPLLGDSMLSIVSDMPAKEVDTGIEFLQSVIELVHYHVSNSEDKFIRNIQSMEIMSQYDD